MKYKRADNSAIAEFGPFKYIQVDQTAIMTFGPFTYRRVDQMSMLSGPAGLRYRRTGGHFIIDVAGRTVFRWPLAPVELAE